MEKDIGIVLHTIKYGETGIIVRIYTSRFGLLSFIIHGVRKASAKVKNSYLQPLNQVEIVFKLNGNNGLQHMSEVSGTRQYNDIPFNILKTSIALFLSEMLSKTLKDTDANLQLFNFLTESLDFLDSATPLNPDFHLIFLVQLSGYLGFQPGRNFDSDHCFFNLAEGVYQRNPGAPDYCLDKVLSAVLNRLSQCTIRTKDAQTASRGQRHQILVKLVDYYRLHHPGVKEIKSLAVLEEVFSH